MAAPPLHRGDARGDRRPGGHDRQGDRVRPRDGGAANVHHTRRGAFRGEGVLRAEAPGRLSSGAGGAGDPQTLRAGVQPGELRSAVRGVRPVSYRCAAAFMGAHAARRCVHDLR